MKTVIVIKYSCLVTYGDLSGDTLFVRKLWFVAAFEDNQSIFTLPQPMKVGLQELVWWIINIYIKELVLYKEWDKIWRGA